MRINRWFILVFLASCSGKGSYNSRLLELRTAGAGQGVLISCTRCHCVTDALAYTVALPQGVRVFGDTLCTQSSGKLLIHPLPQAVLDSVYEENYNIILFRKSGTYYKFRLIETSEAFTLEMIIRDFFNLPD